jgi:hypothetical protein
MSNGAGFTRHPTDCSKFIQCYFGINGLKKMSYQECPWGNFWDQASLTCQPAHRVKCPTGEQRLRIRRGFLKSKKFYYLMKKFRLHLRDNYIYLFQRVKVSNLPKRKHSKSHYWSRDIGSSSESEDGSNASDWVNCLIFEDLKSSAQSFIYNQWHYMYLYDWRTTCVTSLFCICIFKMLFSLHCMHC